MDLREKSVAELPYMKFWPADYMADAHHLTTVEHGAYFLLIQTYWMRGTALPDDDRKLARIAKMSARAWKNARPVLEEFFICDGVIWQHKRIEAELANARQKVKVTRKAGRISASQKKTRKSLKTNNPASTDVEQTLNTCSNRRSNKQSTISKPYNNPLTPYESDGAAPALSGGRAAQAGEAKSIGEVLAKKK